MWRTCSLLIAAAALAAVLLGLAGARRVARPFAFEVAVASSASGLVQVYYDVGRGLSEADSVSAPVTAGPQPAQLRLALPAGDYHLLRFDPLNGAGTITFAGARLVGPGGHPVRLFTARDFAPDGQIAAYTPTAGGAQIRTHPAADDPTLTVVFAPPLPLHYGLGAQFAAAWPVMLQWFLGLLALLVGGLIADRNRAAVAAAWHRARRRPQTSLALLAAAAAVAASYPVVFAGRSFVSPNHNVTLLYGRTPSVPGVTDPTTADTHGADIGAAMWAHLPYSAVENQALLHDHELPLWNRYNSAGVTLLGQGQSMLGDPLHLLAILADGAAWAWDVKIVAAKALFAGGLGWAAWALTGDFFAAALVTLAGAFVGVFNFRLNHPAIFSLGYAPWLLVAWFKVIAAPERRALGRAIGLGVVAGVALMGSGTVKETWMLLLGLHATGALAWWLTPLPAGVARVRRGLVLAVSGAGFALLTAPLWLPFRDALSAARTAQEVPEVWQAPRAWLVGLFDNFFYGELNPEHRLFLPAANFLLLLGVLWAVAQPRRLRRAPGAVALLLGLLTAVALAYEFVPRSWILTVPFLRNVSHVHNTFSGVAVVLAGVLAGWGFAAARPVLGGGRAAPAFAIMGLLVAALLAVYFHDIPSNWLAGAGWRGWTALAPAHAFFYANLALMLLALPLLCGLAARRLHGRPVGAGTVAVAGLALGVLLYRHGVHLSLGFGEDHLMKPAARADLAAPSPAVEFMRRDARAPFRVVGTGRNLTPGYIAVHRLESINGPDAIMNRHYRELAEGAGLALPDDWFFPIHTADLPALRPLLGFLGVVYVATPPADSAAAAGYVPAAALDLAIWRSPTAWPRAFFTDRIESYATLAQFVTRLRLPSGGPPFAAMQNGESGHPVLPAAPGAGTRVQAATDYRLTANATAFTVAAPGPGMIVLHETWEPGDFRATVNGAPAPYFRVNHVFKGIAVDRAGTYRVEFRYWPRHFTLALWLSAAGLALLAGALFLPGRRSSDAGGLFPLDPQPGSQGNPPSP